MKKVNLHTRESYDSNGIRSIEPISVEAFINSPTVPIAQEVTRADVWGDGTYENRGMRVAIVGEKCPIFHDVVEYKSATFVCPRSKEDEVIYWIEHVYGGDCITKRKELDDLRVALRGEYQCW